jgi:hypothetical protein
LALESFSEHCRGCTRGSGALRGGVGEPVAAVEGEEEQRKGCETKSVDLCVQLLLVGGGPLRRRHSGDVHRLRLRGLGLLQVGQLVAVDADGPPDEKRVML